MTLGQTWWEISFLPWKGDIKENEILECWLGLLIRCVPKASFLIYCESCRSVFTLYHKQQQKKKYLWKITAAMLFSEEKITFSDVLRWNYNIPTILCIIYLLFVDKHESKRKHQKIIGYIRHKANMLFDVRYATWQFLLKQILEKRFAFSS